MEKYFILDWFLQGFYPYTATYVNKSEDDLAVDTVIPPIKATVPGSIYKDLMNAGIIDDPFYGNNSLHCEWVANRWWRYVTEIPRSVFKSTTSRKFLCFDGIDNLSNVFWNGESIARFEGANRPVEIEITNLCKETNRLAILIENEPMENGQFTRTSKTNTQKPRYYYKWDFCLRLINMGIYRDAYIKEYEDARLLSCQITDELIKKGANLSFSLDVEAWNCFCATFEIEVLYAGTCVKRFKKMQALEIGANRVECLFGLDEVSLWQPNGCGNPSLYEIVVKMEKDDERLDEYKTVYGFRTIRLLANEGAAPEMQKFLFEVNGKPVYIKGFNFVPIDLINDTSCSEKKRALIRKIKETGANLIRVWGGGYIEDEAFYDECSKCGIMVWQDFLQSSSGTDSIPNDSPEYLEKLYTVSEIAVKTRRNYPCLAVWCGGNELRADDNFHPHDGNCPNLKMLKELVEKEDSKRIFFPTTPFGGNFVVDLTQGTNQNVHGQYKYFVGENGLCHNELYGTSDSLFNGECGVDGLSCMETLQKVLPPERLVVVDGTTDFMWRNHDSWWTTLNRSKAIFGDIETMEDYIYSSQYLQAEGLRFIVDCNRARAFYNSGTVIWQFNEPNPNAGCTCVVDYYLNEKMAYYAIKKAFEPIHGCVKYRKLAFEKGEQIELNISFVNETEEKRSLRVCVIADEGEVLTDKVCECNSVNGRSEHLFDLTYENRFENGLRIELTSGEYQSTVLVLSKGDRGYCNLDYVKRQALWENCD